MPNRILIPAILLPLFMPVFARAQAFVGGGVSSFTPEIATLNVGVVMDVQPTVSYDRKYVTMNMRAQNSQLLNLFQFQFQSPPLANGFVGGVQLGAGAPVSGTFGAVNPPVALAAGGGAAILQTRGMTRIVNSK
jgi:hypothetical protein